jgi:hypothetical protein
MTMLGGYIVKCTNVLWSDLDSFPTLASVASMTHHRLCGPKSRRPRALAASSVRRNAAYQASGIRRYRTFGQYALYSFPKSVVPPFILRLHPPGYAQHERSQKPLVLSVAPRSRRARSTAYDSFHLGSLCNTSDIFCAKGINPKGHELLEYECSISLQTIHGLGQLSTIFRGRCPRFANHNGSSLLCC